VNLRIAHGTGSRDTADVGVYSLREMIDGPMLKRWFSGSDGNLYEPSSLLGANYSTADFGGGDNDFKVSEEDINIGISMKKGNTALKDAINEVLATMTTDDYNTMMDEAISVQPLSE
jgi:hypothetical protein